MDRLDSGTGLKVAHLVNAYLEYSKKDRQLSKYT